jgi:catechol 2,3-dioxygenase-like lactoylglutathione lyase family enzyme
MIDHLSLVVADIARARAFYDAVLATLGARRVMDFDHDARHASAWGPSEQRPVFWLASYPSAGSIPRPPPGQHIAFAAADRAAVDAFHATALAAGGRDDGAPGLRPHYHANYYGAFVIDPDGHRIEAVCHRAPGA